MGMWLRSMLLPTRWRGTGAVLGGRPLDLVKGSLLGEVELSLDLGQVVDHLDAGTLLEGGDLPWVHLAALHPAKFLVSHPYNYYNSTASTELKNIRHQNQKCGFIVFSSSSSEDRSDSYYS